MEGTFDLYRDIAERTDGDVYIGVVGPVRTGKSTFITKFMKSGILDNIANENEKIRTIDEMPQSGSGKTIMTMQPKFIPSEAVEIGFGNGAKASVRLIDCVGYAIEGVGGFVEDGEKAIIYDLEAGDFETHPISSLLIYNESVNSIAESMVSMMDHFYNTVDYMARSLENQSLFTSCNNESLFCNVGFLFEDELTTIPIATFFNVL